MADTTNAQIGSQVTFAIWDTVISSPPAWVDVGKVRSINGYGEDLPEVDSTTLDSTAVERIPGLPDGTEMTIVYTMTASTLALLEAVDAAKVNFDARMVFPAPASTTRYFGLTPRGFDMGSITPSGLIEITQKGRRTGAATTVNPHP